MRILFGNAYGSEPTVDRTRFTQWLARLRSVGFNVEPIDLSLPVPGKRLAWKDLDARWSRGDAGLLKLYAQIARKAEEFDVLVNAGGINLHPEFLRQLHTTNVLLFNDDPVGADYAHPVAMAHHLCLIGNVAELATYRQLGIRNVFWQPMGFWSDDFDPNLTADDIAQRGRDIDVILLCERLTNYRRRNVDTFASSFPQGVFRGRGWRAGFLPEPQRVEFLQRSKIGINVHNSTGPLNFRTYYLPANGILQICDNRCYLNNVFELNKEAVGFDTIEEAIDLCRYYLEHDEERIQIAIAGWKRAITDYNEIACFTRLVERVRHIAQTREKCRTADEVVAHLHKQRELTSRKRLVFALLCPVTAPCALLARSARALMRRAVKLKFDVKFQIGSFRR